MFKPNIKIKRKFNYFLNSLILILIILFTRINIVNASNFNWTEVSKTNAGIQYLDRNSLNNKEKGIIEVTTKYLKIDTKTLKEVEENIYTMEINCLNNKFIDISINGKKKITTKWEDPNGDKLLDDLISDCCKNV